MCLENIVTLRHSVGHTRVAASVANHAAPHAQLDKELPRRLELVMASVDH